MERARRELSVDIAVGRRILKASESTTWARFTFDPKRGAIPKTGINFRLCYPRHMQNYYSIIRRAA